VSFPPSLGPYTSALQRAANEASTRLEHCTLYVVIGIITQTLRVIGMSQANIDKLQRVQNILARVVVGAPWTSSSLNIRRDLHWLPVVIVLPTNCLTTWKTLQPVYLSELISHYLPPRCLRSSYTNLLTRPAGITSLCCVCTFY